MRVLAIIVIIVALLSMNSSCKAPAGPASFCDTVCLKESLEFSLDAHPLKPYVYITASNCMADSLIWSYTDMGVNRKAVLSDLIGTKVRLNKSAVSCFIKDTSYAWLSFNDCANGRGYLLKIPFNKRDNIARKTSAINHFDPKFSVADGMIAYSDRGNLLTEDVATGKQGIMTFGEKLDIDYDAIHEFIDSVNVTPTHMWARVKIAGEWKVFEKDITLK